MSAGGQGQSAVTADKERKIAAAYTVSMRIANARFGGRGFGFWCFDANAGCGWNDEVGVPGSPLMFWHAARENLSAMTPRPFFCDTDMPAMAELHQRLAPIDPTRKSVLIPYDNDEALEVFAETIRAVENPQYAVGAVLIDPNGYFYKGKNGRGAPITALSWFCREFPRIDLIINLNIRMFSLSRKHEWGRDLLSPAALLATLGKNNWLVGRAYKGQSRFILGIGRNMPTGDHAALGLFNAASATGQEILARAESDAQGELSYDQSTLSGVSCAPGFSRRPRGGDAPGARPLSVWRQGDGGSPPSLSAVGHVRCAVQSPADLSSLPLFSGGKE